jgi:hypothetical protein
VAHQAPPPLPPAQLLCRLEWQQQGGEAAAAAAFRRAKVACGPRPHLLNAWAQLQLRQQDVRGARQLLERARAQERGHQHSLQSLAQMEHRAGGVRAAGGGAALRAP